MGGGRVCSAMLLLFVLRVAAAPADKNGASPAKGAPSEGAEPKDAGASDADKPVENSKEESLTDIASCTVFR